MRQIDDATERSLSAPTDATAHTIEGGRAYMADMARRLAPYFTRSQSRHRVVAYLRGFSVKQSARTVGKWRKSAASRLPMASSTC